MYRRRTVLSIDAMTVGRKSRLHSVSVSLEVNHLFLFSSSPVILRYFPSLLPLHFFSFTPLISRLKERGFVSSEKIKECDESFFNLIFNTHSYSQRVVRKLSSHAVSKEKLHRLAP